MSEDLWFSDIFIGYRNTTLALKGRLNSTATLGIRFVQKDCLAVYKIAVCDTVQ